jgi:hypothetical protein
MKRPLYLLISCLSCLAVFMLLDFIVYGDQSPNTQSDMYYATPPVRTTF